MRIIISILLTLFTLAWAGTVNAQGLDISTQVHNAPGWLHSNTYTYHVGPPTNHKTRVNNGPAWNETAYTSGLLLNAYELLDPGGGEGTTCVSAASGGPSGTTSNATDGTCHWKYLSVVDYVTITGWTLDNGSVWASGTNYGMMHVVQAQTGANLDVYQQKAAGCHSTVEPSGTTPNLFHYTGNYILTGDGCWWSYLGRIGYTSRTNPFPYAEFEYNAFQGYLAPFNVSITGSVTSNVLDVTVTGGAIFKFTGVSGVGIATNQYIDHQIDGTPGGVGHYFLGAANSDVASSSLSVNYGILTVTTPPADLPLSTVGEAQSDVVSSATMTGTPGIQGDYFSTYVMAGSGTTYYINKTDTIGSAGSPATFFHSQWKMDLNTADIYHALLWNDREYVGGQNGELNPLTIQDHNFFYNDSMLSFTKMTPPSDQGGIWGFGYSIEAAAGESFADTFAANPTLPLTGYNANNGVGLRGVGVSGLAISDNILVVKRLQIASDMSQVYNAKTRGCNQCTFDHNIMENGTGGVIPYQSPAFGGCGYYCSWNNNLFVDHEADGTVIGADYGGRFFNNTFVCPAANCWSAMDNTWDWINHQGMTISGNAVFGFTHFTTANFYGGAYGPFVDPTSTTKGVGNATDLPNTEGADYPATHNGVDYAMPFYTGASTCGDIDGGFTAGTCEALRSVSPSAAFVSWPTNLRINPSGPLVGGSVATPTYNWCWEDDSQPVGALFPSGRGSWSGCLASATTPDLFGAARPYSGRYDIGAVELQGGGGVSPTFGGRFLFR